jgi:uncharacterized protein (DUF697 family)
MVNFDNIEWHNERANGWEAETEKPKWPRLPASGWFDGLREFSGPWQWDELAAEIGQESQLRVAITGLADSGKSALFNCLRGWSVSWPSGQLPDAAEPGCVQLEPFGSFILARLPAEANGTPLLGEELLLTLGDPALIIYLLDATAGIRPVDYRWIATLRASGRPLVAVLNKCDLRTNYGQLALEASSRLNMPVIPISATTGLHVEERLLPALLDAAPKVAVPLGREVASMRRLAARRLIRQAALFASLIGAQPIPLLDLPVQAALQIGVVMRVGAVYGRAPSGGVNREVVGAVASTLGFRYLALTLAKFAPVLGWAIGSAMSGLMTLTVGEAAIYYHEAGGTVPLRHYLAESRRWLRAKVGR